MRIIGVEVRGIKWVEERWTKGFVGHGTKLDEEREQGVKTPGGAGGKNWWMLTQGADLNLSLRGSVE